MNSHGTTTVTKAELSVSQRARRRVAYRLLPFVFLLYIVNYIDRVNVSFANLVMGNVTGPISIGLDSNYRRNANAAPRPKGVIRNLTFQGIRCTIARLAQKKGQ